MPSKQGSFLVRGLDFINEENVFVDAILGYVYEFFVKFMEETLGFLKSAAYLYRRMFKQDLIRNI